MRLTPAYDLPSVPRQATPAEGISRAGGSTGASAPQFSVLNDFRYLTETDKELLGAATGEQIEPGLTDRTGPASAFAQQLALDRRTGELAPHQDVTGVYLRNAAAAIDAVNGTRAGFRNPYSGPVMDKAVAYLQAQGRGRADIRM